MIGLTHGRFRIGVNFWARDAGPRMWSRFDHAALAAQLVQARAIGIDLLRIFAFIPDFVDGAPGAYTIAPRMLTRMRSFVDQAAQSGVAVLPSPLVGHMSGENFDLPGAAGRDVFSDPEVLVGAVALTSAVARALHGAANVIGYALTNEAPLWGGVHLGARPTKPAIAAWTAALVAACRAGHPGVPVGLGDGLMGGFPNDAVAPSVDFVGPHVYHGDVDPLRQGYRFDHALALAAREGRPTLLEEFGGSSSQVGDPEQAALWNEALFAAFTLGAHGALGWCWSDFPVETVGLEVPYEHHAFELGFGVTRADGSEKPVCATLRAWRELVDALPDAPPVRDLPRAAILRSRFVEHDYPFSWMERGLVERAELSAYVLASQAGLQPSVLDEAAIADAPLLVIAPSMQRLLTPTWLALEAHARGGGTVYWSYGGGDHAFHQGAWCPIFERLTGCTHRLRYGCFDLPPDELALDGVLAGLTLPTGTAEVRAGRGELGPGAAYLPIEPVEGRALVHARDQLGRPMLIEHRIGAGRVIFCAAPLERYAARLIDGTTRSLSTLYRWLGEVAGVPTSPIAGAEQLCTRSLSVGGQPLVAVMNRSFEPAPLPPLLSAMRGEALMSHAPLGGGDATHLGPKQVLVLRRAAPDGR